MRELDIMWKCILKKKYMQVAIFHTLIMSPFLFIYFLTDEIEHTLFNDIIMWVNLIIIVYWASAFINVYLAIKKWIYIDLLTNSYTNGKKM